MSTSAGRAPRPTRRGSSRSSATSRPTGPIFNTFDDAAVLRAELERIRAEYNGVRLHAGIGYVTPDDEHEGRGPAIRQARRDGLAAARERRIAAHRAATAEETTP